MKKRKNSGIGDGLFPFRFFPFVFRLDKRKNPLLTTGGFLYIMELNHANVSDDGKQIG